MKSMLLVAIAFAAVACSSPSDLVPLRANIGKSACNQTNGIYVGQIVDVTTYSGSGQSPATVYVVERDGRRHNAPVANTSVAERCPDGQPLAQPAPETTVSTQAPEVDGNLRPVAAEFNRRLAANQGALISMKMESNALKAKWTSEKCDAGEGEVIDLLLSLNRGHPGPFTPGIEGEFKCGDKTRHFSAPVGRFQQYRTGQINDLAVLRGLK